jgi:hypothetical protein
MTMSNVPTINALLISGTKIWPYSFGRMNDRKPWTEAVHDCCASENAPEINACDATMAAMVATTSNG